MHYTSTYNNNNQSNLLLKCGDRTTQARIQKGLRRVNKGLEKG